MGGGGKAPCTMTLSGAGVWSHIHPSTLTTLPWVVALTTDTDPLRKPIWSCLNYRGMGARPNIAGMVLNYASLRGWGRWGGGRASRHVTIYTKGLRGKSDSSPRCTDTQPSDSTCLTKKRWPQVKKIKIPSGAVSSPLCSTDLCLFH